MSKNEAPKISESEKNCLSYDTEILAIVRGITPVKVPIGLIVERKYNCLVYSVDRETGSDNIQAIEQWHDHGKQEVFEYTLENGTTIKATKNHKFMTADGQMLPIDEIYERGLDLVCRHSYTINGYDFKPIIPDYYTCPYTYGNTCGFGIVKLDTIYVIEHNGCTEGYRTFGDSELDRKYNSKDYSLCFNNWMLSESIYYEKFSPFVNDCINGYRNITYVKQQQAIDSNFNIEQAKTPKHTYIALNTVINQALQLEKFLKESNQFDENQLFSFSRYLERRYFRNYFRILSGGGTPGEIASKKDIFSCKEIFDYIIANPEYINELVSQKMIDEFNQQYKTYQKDAKKYAQETLEERRVRLNQELAVRGIRAMRFP